MGTIKGFVVLALLSLLISCGGGGGGGASTSAVSSIDLVSVGVAAIAVQDEGDTLTVLQGGSSSATLALETDANTTASDLAVSVLSSSTVGVAAIPADVPVTVKIAQDTATGVWTLTSTVTSQASGIYPFTVKVTNTKTGKSATSTFKINAAVGQAVATSTVSAGTLSATLTTTAGHSFVIEKGGLNSDLHVQIVQTTTDGGKTLTRLVFDQDIAGKNVAITLPDLNPVTTPDTSNVSPTIQSYIAEKISSFISDGTTAVTPPYARDERSLGVTLQTYPAWFLNSGDHRVPNGTKLNISSSQSFTATGGARIVELPARSYTGSRLTGVTAKHSIALPADTDPVLFVHGFLASPTTALLGGGKGTWANFPALVSVDDGIGIKKRKFLPFEFQWATDARFEDVAVDLAKAINTIKSRTGKNVHVIAHSFGGTLVRTLLQKQTVNYPAQWTSTVDNAVASVASLVTLGSPHSGIGDKAVGGIFPGSSQTFPNGQDAGTFDGCKQVSCHQMGEKVSGLNTVLSVNAEPGEMAAKLFTSIGNLPPIDIVVGIGLTRYNETANFGKGDLLISYAGQRLLPTDATATATLPLRRGAVIGGAAVVYETVLGTVNDIRPGDAIDDYGSTSRSFGYVHSGSTGAANISIPFVFLKNVDGMTISSSNSAYLPIANQGQVYGLEAAPASSQCVATASTANAAAATCDHAGFILFRDLMDGRTCAFVTGGVCITNVQNDSSSTKVTIANGGTTSDATPLLSGTIAGTVAGGKVVRIYDGFTLLGNATVSTTPEVDRRSWTFTPSALSAGTHILHAVTTGTNDTTAIGGGMSWTVTVTAPAAITSVAVDTGNTLSSSTASSSTTDTTPTLRGTLSATLATGQVLRVYDGSTVLGTATVTGATWSFTPTTALSVGSHSISVVVYSSGGVQSGASSGIWAVTITAPLTPSVSSISPLVASLGVATTFTVTGANLPITATLSIAGAACGATSNATISGFMAVCTAASTGSKTATVKTNTDVLGGTVIDATRLINVRGLNPLNDTGITSSQCFAAGGTSFYSCSSVAALALSSAQDGMVGRDVTAPDGTDGVLGFSFSLVPKTGGGTYDKTECVKDNVTGLMWEGKTTGGARTFGLLYTNYHTQTGNTSQNTYGYVAYVNALALCGYTDWRLPSVHESLNVVDYGGNFVSDNIWFVNQSYALGHWTASVDNATPLRAWATVGGVALLASPNAYGAIRLVRGNAVPQANFIYSSDGSEVTDNVTGLTWRRCAEGMTWNASACIGTANQYSQSTALSRAANQSTVSGRKWRVPNVKELSSLVIRGSPSYIDGVAFPSTPKTQFMTSTPLIDNGAYYYPYYTGDKWFVDFGNGEVNVGARTTELIPLRLVRDSP